MIGALIAPCLRLYPHVIANVVLLMQFGAMLALLPGIARAGVKVFDSPDHSLELGMRLQPRMEFAQLPLPEVDRWRPRLHDLARPAQGWGKMLTYRACVRVEGRWH